MLGPRGPPQSAPRSARTPRTPPECPVKCSVPKDPLRVPPEDPLIVAPDSCPLPITTVPGQATRPPAETPRACRQRLRWVEAWVQPSSEDLGSSPSLGRARGGSHRLSLMGHCRAVFRLLPASSCHFSPTSRKSLVLNVHSPSLPLPSCFPEILTLGCLIGPRPFSFSRPTRLRGASVSSLS